MDVLVFGPYITDNVKDLIFLVYFMFCWLIGSLIMMRVLKIYKRYFNDKF